MQPIWSNSEPIHLNGATQKDFEDLLVSTAETLDQAQPAFLLVHAYDAVLVGAVINGAIKVRDPMRIEYLMDLRLFSAAGELHIWRGTDKLCGRLRIDRDQEPASRWWIQEEHHGMWGTGEPVFENGWWQLAEKRVSPIWVPFKAKKEMIYKVRNYFVFDEDGLACFQDARLCGFFYKNQQPVEWV